jgi:hypothetical protein
MYRKIWLCIVVGWAASSAAGQELFNNRYHFGYAANVLTSIEVKDSLIYATGIIADTVPPYRTGAVFAALQHDGTPASAIGYLDTAGTYQLWHNNLAFSSDGNLLAAGYRTTDLMRALLMKFTPAGDTVFAREYLSYFYPSASFVMAKALAEDAQQNIYLVNYAASIPDADADITVLKVDALGNPIWHRRYGTDLLEEPCGVKILGDEVIILGYRANTNITRKNFTAQTHIFAIDAEGQVRWQYLSPAGSLQGRRPAFHVEPDGSIIVATLLGEEVVVNPSRNAIKWGTGYLYKLSPQRQVEWSVRFEDPFPAFSSYSSLNKLVKASDGSGYLAAGYLPHLDEAAGLDLPGWLLKVSPSGDSLWSRHLRFLEPGTPPPHGKHELYDLEEMPDGGYLLAGQVTYYHEPVPPIQRGWLLKVDEHGCLVPGCQLVSTREAGAPPAPALHLYPNPASETLYVLLKDERIAQRQGAQLRLLDLQGRPLRAWPAGPFDEVTSVLPLQGLPAGLYVLQYVGDGQVLGAERVVVR